MTEFILLILLTSLWCFGVRTLFSEGFLLARAGDWAWGKSEFLSKPLFQCPPCMSSIHGTYAYFMFFDHQHLTALDTVGLWVAFCVCLCGLNYLVLKFIEPIE